MSLRPIRLVAGLLLTSLAFGVAPAAPALADGMITPPARYHVRHHVRHHWHAPLVVTRVVYVPYTTGCGGCATPVAYVPAPLPTYRYSGWCGSCGYAPTAYTYSGYLGTGYDPEYTDYAPGYSTGYRYSTGYYGGGYVRPALRVASRFADTRVGFRRGFYGRRFR